MGAVLSWLRKHSGNKPKPTTNTNATEANQNTSKITANDTVKQIVNKMTTDTVTSSGSSSDERLSIIVVGAGLGGLGAAISCAMGGHKVRVIEQAKEISEVSSACTHAFTNKYTEH